MPQGYLEGQESARKRFKAPFQKDEAHFLKTVFFDKLVDNGK